MSEIEFSTLAELFQESYLWTGTLKMRGFDYNRFFSIDIQIVTTKPIHKVSLVSSGFSSMPVNKPISSEIKIKQNRFG